MRIAEGKEISHCRVERDLRCPSKEPLVSKIGIEFAVFGCVLIRGALC